MAHPDLVAALVVQHIAAAHVELAGRQRGGYGNLQRQRFAVQIRLQHPVMPLAQLPQLRRFGDALSHQDGNHPGGVGDSAAAHAHQRIGAGGYRQIRRIHCRRQGRPLRQAGIDAHRQAAQRLIDLAHRRGGFGQRAAGQHQRPPPAQRRDFGAQRGGLTLAKDDAGRHRRIEFALQDGISAHSSGLRQGLGAGDAARQVVRMGQTGGGG